MSLRVLSAGNRLQNRGTVLFLHGVGAHADRWTQSLRACADAGWLAVALDFPGHGYATKGRSRYLSVPGFAECARKVRQMFGAEHLSLVGTSLGGHVAAEMTAAEPALTRRLVLIGPIGIAAETMELRTRIANAIADTTRQGIADKLHRVLFDDTLVTDDWVDEEFVVNNSDGAADSFAALADYFRTGYSEHTIGTRLRDAAPRLPCLLVWGAADQLVPASNADKVKRLLPSGTRTHLIEKTGHAPYFERPDEFHTVLLDFLNHDDDHHRSSQAPSTMPNNPKEQSIESRNNPA
jgi:pimeloyl-ACP methyl ester carboxylesterase